MVGLWVSPSPKLSQFNPQLIVSRSNESTRIGITRFEGYRIQIEAVRRHVVCTCNYMYSDSRHHVGIDTVTWPYAICVILAFFFLPSHSLHNFQSPQPSAVAHLVVLDLQLET